MGSTNIQAVILEATWEIDEPLVRIFSLDTVRSPNELLKKLSLLDS